MARTKTELRQKQDQTVKDFIEREVLPHMDSHDIFAGKVDAWTKRFEAIRSIQGLDYGDDPDKFPKLEPWKWSSDVGIPIEAITIRAIIARFIKTIFQTPICNITGRGQSDREGSKVVQEYNEYSLRDEMNFERQYYDILMDTCLDGDGIGHLIEADEDYEWEETYFTLLHPETEEPIPDPSTKNEFDEEWPNGYPIEVDENFQPTADLRTGLLPQVKEITITKKDKVYFGTKLIPIDPRNLVLPEGANNSDYDELPFLGEKLEKNWHWLDARTGEVEDGGYDEDAVQRIKPNTDSKKVSTVPKIKLLQVNAKIEMPTNVNESKTKIREVIALYALSSGDLLGWILNPYRGRRQYYHWQIMPMPHRARGKGIPEFARGIRDLVDSLLNNMVNRDTVNSHPPFVYDEASGFDPEIHEFGPQEFWGVTDKTKLGRLDMGNYSEARSQWIIEFTLGMIQKLFGVNDYTLGSDSGTQNKTARGIQAIIGEGNFSFDTMISLLNMENKKFFEGNILMTAKMLKDAGMERKVFYVTESEEDPYREIEAKTMSMKWNFIPRGTSIDNNVYRKKQDAQEGYNLLSPNIFFSPELMPETLNNLSTITQNLVDAFNIKGIKIPNAEQLKKQLEAHKAAVQVEAQKTQQLETIKSVARLKKGTPEGEAAKKVLEDIELSGQGAQPMGNGIMPEGNAGGRMQPGRNNGKTKRR